MIFVSARICLLVLVCVVSATSALDDVAKPTAAAAAVYGSVCEERIGGLDLVLLVDECKFVWLGRRWCPRSGVALR